MKTTILLFALVIYQVQGLTPWFAHRSLVKSLTYGCQPGKAGPTCSDCNTRVFCDNDGNTLMIIPCEETKNKYCDLDTSNCGEQNTCSSQGPSSTTMDCKFPGFFVDPMNCNRFFFCEEGTGQAKVYKCPSSTKYDPVKKLCVSSTVCKTYSSETNGLCFGKSIQAIAMADPSTYVICPAKGIATKLFSCATRHERYDSTIHSCKFVCPGEGFYASADPSKYFSCVKEVTGMKTYEQKCQAGTAFDASKGFCYTVTAPPEIEQNGDQ